MLTYNAKYYVPFKFEITEIPPCCNNLIEEVGNNKIKRTSVLDTDISLVNVVKRNNKVWKSYYVQIKVGLEVYSKLVLEKFKRLCNSN